MRSVFYTQEITVHKSIKYGSADWHNHINTFSLHLLTYFMKQSPSWEANQFAASQEIPRFLLNLKVHYRIHKCPPPVPILSQLNSVHAPT